MPSAARAIRTQQKRPRIHLVETDASRRAPADERREERVRLVARVQIAYEHLRGAIVRGAASQANRAAIDAARTRLAALNLALAIVAIQAE
jgi:hypothetical protein